MVACPKCAGKLDWEERSWTIAGEDPGHWRCVNCGEVIYQNSTGLQKQEQNISKHIPSDDCDGKGEQEIMEETRMCTKCGATKSIADFNKNAARLSGHDTRCRICTAQAQRDRKARLAEKEKGRPINRRKKRQSRNPGPVRSPVSSVIISNALTLDAQLAIDLKAMKKRIAQEIMQICNKAIEEAFA